MKTILVPVDFSDLTLKLLKAAIHLAKPFRSKIIVLHVSDEGDQMLPIGSGPDVLPPPPPLEELSADAFNDGLNRLKEMVTSVGLEGTTVQLQGAAVDLILAQAESSHSRGLIYHLLVGSVVEGVLKRARCPVLVVPVHDEIN
jgi:nucleotide-binding universal stress UspA family protein